SMGLSVDAVRRATLRVRFDLARRSASVRSPHAIRYPFESWVEMEDDRGKVHVGTVRDEWPGDVDPDRPDLAHL
ncbi:MAG TPA: hypothetical protein VEQ60_09710, partial [Longimicrobium sp.]|nr:hypothetical protein [Longimicrobium sp.]